MRPVGSLLHSDKKKVIKNQNPTILQGPRVIHVYDVVVFFNIIHHINSSLHPK